ncbi:peptidase [Streptomyces sp. NRRL B-24572]|uniref:peptidase n=1 Tax=Streptomyces sp. NRRL B-24572 TaxID=1962156 RepID=UPI00211B2BA1|nr:peptidase [Streptomyces sp. NRRL B-24572]
MLRRRMLTTVGGAAAALGLVLATAGSSSAATSYSVAPGYRVNVRSGPGTQYAIVQVLPLDATVSIYCQVKYGETITGPYGTTSIWDNIGPGKYVSDAYVHTGSDAMVAPPCGG